MFLDDLKSAIYLSLRCKKQTPKNIESGWWGNSLLGGEIGSYLYTLDRSPLIQNTADEAALFTREALSWLDDDPKILTCIKGNKLQLQLNLKGEKIDI